MWFFFVSVGMVERIQSTYYHPSSEKRPRDKKTEEEKKRRRVEAGSGTGVKKTKIR